MLAILIKVDDMSREIKFRAFVKEYNPSKEAATMVYSDRIGGVGVLFRDFEDEPIMQYTGLKDKNGVEIYENSEIDDEFVVSTKGCDYVLISISSGDIVRLQDYYSGASGNVKVTREYAGVQEDA